MTAFQPGSPAYEALIAERAELRAEIEGLREEVAILRTTEAADNERLRAAIQGFVGRFVTIKMSRAALEPKP